MTKYQDALEAYEHVMGAIQAYQDSLLELESDPGDLDLEGTSNLIARTDRMRQQVVDCSLVLLPLAKARRTDEELVVTDLGVAVEYGFTGGRKEWEHDRLKALVAEAVMVRNMDLETGTLEAPATQLIAEALECAGIGYWKVKELKKLSINADDHSTKVDGHFKATTQK